jgi:sec-independent protein translocase protein TatA
MGSLSIWHWMIVLAVGLLLFGGRGKVSELMGDFAKGIKSFKKGLADDDTADTAKSDAAMKSIDHQAAAAETARRAEADSKVERTLS